MVDTGALVGAAVVLITAIAGAIGVVNRLVGNALKKAEEADAAEQQRLADLERDVTALQTQATRHEQERAAWKTERDELLAQIAAQGTELEKQRQAIAALEDAYRRVQESYTSAQVEWQAERAQMEQRITWLTEQYKAASEELARLREELQQAQVDRVALKAQNEAYEMLVQRLDRWLPGLIDSKNAA
jgi:chromosome segregation ATPase